LEGRDARETCHGEEVEEDLGDMVDDGWFGNDHLENAKSATG
jgi:hypothetical protein